MKVIVTGGRDYINKDKLFNILNLLNNHEYPIEYIIQGGAKGADELARLYAETNNIFNTKMGLKLITYKAEWGKYGKSAGPIRNQTMLESNKDAIVVAFNGGKGTANCINLAKKLNMIIIKIEE